jgi:hypothetical protein
MSSTTKNQVRSLAEGAADQEAEQRDQEYPKDRIVLSYGVFQLWSEATDCTTGERIAIQRGGTPYVVSVGKELTILCWEHGWCGMTVEELCQGLGISETELRGQLNVSLVDSSGKEDKA